MVRSFAELFDAVRARRDAGDSAGALALVQGRESDFPLHRGLIHLVEAEILAETGDRERALDVLRQAHVTGCRYKREWLETNSRLAALASLHEFVELVERSARRYEEDASAARPELTVTMPSTSTRASGSGYPLLIVLHGNNSNARETVRQWSAAAISGWVVAIPQSSEIGVSPDAYTWNDRERTATEVEAHIADLRRKTSIDAGKIVLAGFSMGGLQAIAIPLTGRIAACGYVAVAAWLPQVQEFTKLVEGGTARHPRGYLLMGESDPSYEGARRLVDLLTRHDIPARLDAREGLGHEYPADMDETLGRALEFVATVS